MQTIDKPFRDLTRAAFARYGFAYADLIGQWPAIVGEHLAAICRPERIKWPRQGEAGEARSGGTLILRAAPGRALDLQHETPGIIERINGFYGYAAIAAIKIRQDQQRPAVRQRALSSLDAASAASLDARLETIADDALRAALRRLGTGALARANSQQAK
jgi:hypothetical protein